MHSIQYSVKKTTWQSGGQFEIRFVSDSLVKFPEYNHSGKATTVKVAPGLPKNSQPQASTQKQPQMSKINMRQAAAASQNPQRVFSPPSQSSNRFPTPSMAPPSSAASPPMGRGTLSTNSLNNTHSNTSMSNPSLNAAAAAKKRPPPPPPKKAPMVRALYDYQATEAGTYDSFAFFNSI